MGLSRPTLAALCLVLLHAFAHAQSSASPLRVFLFAGQSNMVGADTDPELAESYPPYAGITKPRADVRYAFSVGRSTSDGFVPLAPVDADFGPELTFAREVAKSTKGKFAILKCAVGGTTIARDWNPDAPDDGQKLYPRFVQLVRDSLARLDRAGVAWRLEALFWHQGENDMLSREFNPEYEAGFTRFLARLRSDLGAPELPVFLGEVSDRGIWGMDFRGPMRALRAQQRAVADADPHAQFVATSHLAFEVMGSGQPHYHFGTLGQLQHGEAYAEAYLRSIGLDPAPEIPGYPKKLPFRDGQRVRVFALLGQRSMEGEGTFVQELSKAQRKPRPSVPFRYHVGGGARVSADWTPLAPAGFFDGFGPELGFGTALDGEPIAIVKFTDGAAQITDWAVEHADASRPCRDDAIAFLRTALDDLTSRGLEPELAGIVWHHGENERYYAPFRNRYAEILRGVIADFRTALDAPELPWILAGISTKAPWGAESIAQANGELRALADSDAHIRFVDTSDLPHGRAMPGSEGTWELGRLLGESCARTEDGRPDRRRD
ncbi:MAG: hypothetical protein O2865_10565 [Planctomycetota bacterium]|nr:hypothetical protein [Planctomycetota bacterium]